MRLLFLISLIFNISYCFGGSIKCEKHRQYNEARNRIETVQICWDEDEDDAYISDTVKETVLSDCIYINEVKHKLSGHRAAEHCATSEEK